MIVSLFIFFVFSALAESGGIEARKYRVPLGPIKFNPSLEFMPKLNLTTSQRKSIDIYNFVPEIQESADKGQYTVSFIFPDLVNVQKINFQTFHFGHTSALIVNGSMDTGVIGFRYRKLLSKDIIISEFKLEHDSKNNHSVTMKAPTTSDNSFANKLLESSCQLENNKYKIYSYLPGLSRDDIYLVPTEEYLFTAAFKKSVMSYEEERIWPICTTKDYEWEYDQEVLTVWIVLSEDCLKNQ